MKKNIITKFGLIKKVTKGKGKIVFKNDQEFSATLFIVQYSDGNLLLFSEFHASIVEILKIYYNRVGIKSATGRTTDGKVIDLSNLGVTFEYKPITGTDRVISISFINQCIVGDINSVDVGQIIFEVVNFQLLV
jgi:hypothetical protein